MSACERSFFSTPFIDFICRREVGATGADRAPIPRGTLIPFDGYEKFLNRRFEEAIGIFLASQERDGLSDGLASALAAAYRGLAFQTLADQVRRSVRSVRGKSMDVSRRASGRLSTAAAAGTAEARRRRAVSGRCVSDFARGYAPCGWT
ncbi:MAG: hypothetical protein WDM87_13890 [Terracidiphilus sp.]